MPALHHVTYSAEFVYLQLTTLSKAPPHSTLQVIGLNDHSVQGAVVGLLNEYMELNGYWRGPSACALRTRQASCSRTCSAWSSTRPTASWKWDSKRNWSRSSNCCRVCYTIHDTSFEYDSWSDRLSLPCVGGAGMFHCSSRWFIQWKYFFVFVTVICYL